MPVRLINPSRLCAPRGYSHAAMGRNGFVVTLAGQIGCGQDGRIEAPGDLVAQFDKALENLVIALRRAEGSVKDLAFLRIYVTDVGAYRDRLDALGAAYRARLGKHFPPMALLGVTELFDPEALVEIEGLACVEDRDGDG